MWLWLEALPPVAADANEPGGEASRPGSAASSSTRRRTRQVKQGTARALLLLPSKTEQLMSWADHVPLDRATDDEDDGNATRAADDMEQLALTRDGQAGAARVKFDLDLRPARAPTTGRSVRARRCPSGTGSSSACARRTARW